MAYAWWAQQRRLNDSEQMENVQNIVHYFRTKNWTDEAIAGMLGNIQNESAFNPAAEEGYNVYYAPSENHITPTEQWWIDMYNGKKRGYGLTQWTPARKYKIWACQEICRRAGVPYYEYYVADLLQAMSYNSNKTSGLWNGIATYDYQLERIEWERANNEQWAHYWGIYSTFDAFSKGTNDAGYMAKAFMRCYERPANISEENMNARAQQGIKWYNIIQDIDPPQTNGLRIYLFKKLPFWQGGKNTTW